MTLPFETYSKATGGNPLFKALGHPLVRPRASALARRLTTAGRVALFDPFGQFACFAAYHDLSAVTFAGRYVQRREDLGGDGPLPGLAISDLGQIPFDCLLIAAFDSEPALRACQPLLPADIPVLTFDELRLPAEMLSNPRRYLDPLNFASTLALFRNEGGRRTVVSTAEYWTRYGAKNPELFLTLFDHRGADLACWRLPLEAGQAITLDAGEVAERFELGEFTGSLFIHACRVAGHDVIKYVLDDYDAGHADPVVTHDANSWPADFYAGLPAAAPGEKVRLWLQNTHPIAVPPGTLRLNRMGRQEARGIEQEIPAFGTLAVDLAGLFPEAEWPAQYELSAQRHVVRPIYEIARPDGTVTFAHINVERGDLQPDPEIAKLGPLFGKGYVLTAPLLPTAEFETVVLPTPMARSQRELPLTLLAFDAEGREVARWPLGRLPRDHATAIDVTARLAERGIAVTDGHLELIYDFSAGGEADGWMHALFRITRRGKLGTQSGETSFGSHIFNTPMVYKDEPQSYNGRAPGLSTRLFMRLAPSPLTSWCCLIYPASRAWHATSTTKLILHDASGVALAERTLAIPCSGSRFWCAEETFTTGDLTRAGPRGYVLIQDATCRLFGYHATQGPTGAFALDHMFGF